MANALFEAKDFFGVFEDLKLQFYYSDQKVKLTRDINQTTQSFFMTKNKHTAQTMKSKLEF